MGLRFSPIQERPIIDESNDLNVGLSPLEHDPEILDTDGRKQMAKRWIITLVAFAGWFSSLSSFIYFPAILSIASDLDLATERINLTISAYLIMSGVFPSIVGSAADTVGRRPVFIVTLAIYVAANFGLALQSSFGLLFVLRMVQSAGISGSYSVTYGVLGDLFTPSERGGYSGLIFFILNTPPSVGPVISGFLIQRWGWRSIFWFLAIISPCCLVAILMFLPETSRHVVGDGRVAATGPNRVFFSCLTPSKLTVECQVPTSGARSCRYPRPWASLAILRWPGTAIVIGSVGIYYTIYTCIQASLSSLFTQIYHTSGLVSGLTYLPFGLTCAISAFATGTVKFSISNIDPQPPDTIYVDKTKNHDLASFPIEEARLRIVKYSLVRAVGTAIKMLSQVDADNQKHMAVPLVLQFFIGLTMQVVFTSTCTLLVDLHPECPSTTQATSNFIRCEMSAGMLALLDALLGKLGCQENDDQHLQLMDYGWHPLKRGRIAETPVQTLGNTQYIQSNCSPLLQSHLLPFFNLHRVADNYSLIHRELKALQRYEREGANIRDFCQRKNILCKGADPAPYTWRYFETCQLGFTKQSSSFLQLTLLFSSWESISAPIAIPLPPTTQEGGAGKLRD
ncbi:Major Facilitator Superfamily protein [Penicillium brasilianum]|uniref:Major Facilitator Superfamily protein n=1 Tax=Penicillium brasilianum TaxID=104259 RepID=A0A1S9RPL2_PENBI|nr:Major Facilitator Superfamily protein [Penicillium brasilianum]